MYDQTKADHAVNFINCLKHTKGQWRGVPFELLPWQDKIIRDIFGTVKENGYRQYNTAYVEIPKKNGKSELAAAVALLMTCGDGEWGAEVYGCASDRQQASIVFDVAVDMVDQCPALKKRIKPIMSVKRLVYQPTNSFYQVLSAEAYTKHGLNVHAVIFDELHAQPNRELFDVRMKRKFWNWVRNENDESRTLFLNGEISDETWYGDEVTPKMFKEELQDGEGDITVWINSPGGDVFAAAQIYNMLMDYKGNVTVKIDGLAASAASVIAMAGTEVQMSPVAMMMIHNPATIAIGDSSEMKKAIDMLDEVKESIMNAYEIKTGLSRSRISHLMDAESWFNAKKAVELGFADKLLFSKEETEAEEEKELEMEAVMFSRKAVTNSLMSKLISKPEKKTPIEQLEKRLSLLAH